MKEERKLKEDIAKKKRQEEERLRNVSYITKNK